MGEVKQIKERKGNKQKAEVSYKDHKHKYAKNSLQMKQNKTKAKQKPAEPSSSSCPKNKPKEAMLCLANWLNV